MSPNTQAPAGADLTEDPRTRCKPLIRTARLIHRELSSTRATPLAELRTRLAYLADEFMEIDRLQKNLRHCENHGWFVAGRRVQQDVLRFVDDLRARLVEVEKHANPRKSESPISPIAPALGDIVRELQQIGDEFDHWSFDEVSKQLSVTTDEITLEGIHLGAFDVVLHLSRLGSSSNRAYTVEAQDPNRPTGNDAISHPHISDDVLCAGEAVAPIRRALADGRFCDFYLLVKGVVETYNPSSAYVKLSDWEGTPCHDCGDRTDGDDLCGCGNCDHDFCPQCSSSCEACNNSRCNDCLSTCARCEVSVCEECRGYCYACKQTCCRSCQNKDGLCTECAEPEDTEGDDLPVAPPNESVTEQLITPEEAPR